LGVDHLRPAVFLDRDGTLIEEAGYLDRLERLAFFPFSVDAVRVLNRTGLPVVIVTNQAGVARGIFKESFIAEAHRHIGERLGQGGAAVAGFYYCPHHPDASVAEYRKMCDCRKPEPGMLRRAAAELHLDLSRSFVVGDRWHDVEAGRAIGARTLLVRTGYGRTEESASRPTVAADAIVDNLMEAASWILRAS
jgi:D-glycero-D-manno-heptose 1,7-bisphosphate phosphatase